MTGFWDGIGISWTICKQSAPRSRQITTSTPHHSMFTGRMLFLTPNQQRPNTEAQYHDVYKPSLTNFQEIFSILLKITPEDFLRDSVQCTINCLTCKNYIASYKIFQQCQLNSRRFPVFPGAISNSKRFPGFPGVADTLNID